MVYTENGLHEWFNTGWLMVSKVIMGYAGLQWLIMVNAGLKMSLEWLI